MFYPNPSSKTKVNRNFATFLFILLSAVTFHKNAFAGKNESTVEELRHKGYQEQQKGHLEEALSYYSKALVGNSNPSNVLNDIGVIYEQLGLDEKAESKYLEAIQADSGYLPPYMNLAYFYQRKQNLAKALEYFQTRIELGDPNDLWTQKAVQEVARIKQTIPNYREKLILKETEKLQAELIRKASDESAAKMNQANAYYEEGQMLVQKEKYREALNAFDQALKIIPNNPKFLKAKESIQIEIAKEQINIGSQEAVRMLNAGDVKSASKEIRKMLSIIPEN